MEDIHLARGFALSSLSSPRFNRKVARRRRVRKTRKTNGRRKLVQRSRETTPDDAPRRSRVPAALHGFVGTVVIYSRPLRAIVFAKRAAAVIRGRVFPTDELSIDPNLVVEPKRYVCKPAGRVFFLPCLRHRQRRSATCGLRRFTVAAKRKRIFVLFTLSGSHSRR